MLAALQAAVMIAVVQLVFTEAWKIIAIAPFLLVNAARIPYTYRSPIIKCIGLTIFFGISSAIVLQVARLNHASVPLIATAGGLILAVGTMQAIAETRQVMHECASRDHYDLMKEGTKYDLFAYVYGLAFYVLAISVPSIGTHRVFTQAAAAISWLTDIPILGAILYLAGFILAIAQLYKGASLVVLLIALASSRPNSE